MLTPRLQQPHHTGGEQNTCWLKPDKAALGFRSGTANRSYLYLAPVQTQSLMNSHQPRHAKWHLPFPFPQGFLLTQFLQLLTAVPPQLPHKGCLPAGSGEHKLWCCSCSEHKLQNFLLAQGLAHLPWALPQPWHKAGSSAPAPAAHPKLPRLFSLASCRTVTKRASAGPQPF